MDPNELPDGMGPVTKDERPRGLSASLAGGSRKNPRLEVAHPVSLTTIFVFVYLDPLLYMDVRGGSVQMRVVVDAPGVLPGF